ncbi:hypothetical protein B0H12DRAFT_1235919 [Mycena haematopus]|nr:hypothetical protein B0H12DRAFT_1235919 [Mycena haematopus]
MNSTVSNNEWATVLSEIIQSATSLFLNGICILLVVQACHLLNRRRSAGWGVLLCAVVVAGSFSIGQMIQQVVVTAKLLRLHHSADTVQVAGEQQRLRDAIRHLSETKTQRCDIFLVVNNFFTDGLFIYRCYVVWGDAPYRKRVLCLSLILMLFTTVFGIATTSISWNPTASTVVVGLGMIAANVFSTGLTAGRIWWIKRRVQVIGITSTQLVRQRYNTAITLLLVFRFDLESSALYFAFMLAWATVRLLGSPALLESPAVSVLNGASPQVMNIIPALLVVRVCLARSVDVDPTAGELKLESDSSV